MDFVKDDAVPKPVDHKNVIETALAGASARTVGTVKQTASASKGRAESDKHQALAARMVCPSKEEATSLCSTSSLATHVGCSRQHLYPMMYSFACAAYDTVREAMSMFVQRSIYRMKQRVRGHLVQPICAIRHRKYDGTRCKHLRVHSLIRDGDNDFNEFQHK
eukprot:798220-Pyramimonas_sp.AAC.1